MASLGSASTSYYPGTPYYEKGNAHVAVAVSGGRSPRHSLGARPSSHSSKARDDRRSSHGGAPLGGRAQTHTGAPLHVSPEVAAYMGVADDATGMSSSTHSLSREVEDTDVGSPPHLDEGVMARTQHSGAAVEGAAVMRTGGPVHKSKSFLDTGVSVSCPESVWRLFLGAPPPPHVLFSLLARLLRPLALPSFCPSVAIPSSLPLFLLTTTLPPHYHPSSSLPLFLLTTTLPPHYYPSSSLPPLLLTTTLPPHYHSSSSRLPFLLTTTPPPHSHTSVPFFLNRNEVRPVDGAEVGRSALCIRVQRMLRAPGLELVYMCTQVWDQRLLPHWLRAREASLTLVL
jgi:hypothetical protein